MVVPLANIDTMVYLVDPLSDPRWSALVGRHPRSSIFHTSGWLQSVAMTYGYRPVVYTCDPPEIPLSNGIVCCQVNSWLTGRRLVSLPFSDHCEPLVNNPDELGVLLGQLVREPAMSGWRYVELRSRTPLEEGWNGLVQDRHFYLHSLDLRPSLENIFHNFHKDCVQRKIHRAERQGLSCEEGRSALLLDKFYHLLLLTRRRHQLPPQPLTWFKNLIACMGKHLKIRVASKDGQPIAGILTLRYKDTMVYKYGCSDARFHNLGGMALLFWEAIQDAKAAGLGEFDFGRSDLEQTGLITFKNHWGATMSELVYMRYPRRKHHFAKTFHRKVLAKRVFERLPDGILVLAGKLLYKHIG